MPIPAPDAATTPMAAEDAWRYNEDSDVKLICLRLFALQQRAHLLHEPLALCNRQVRLCELLPCMTDNLGELVVRFASHHVVRAEVLQEALLPDTLLDLVARCATLPFAAINKEKTTYADSILLLELDKPAPRELCLGKTMLPKHENVLAVLFKSNLHHCHDSTSSERFQLEYTKCIKTPLPFIFIFISDASTVTSSNQLSWPYNGNGYFVGRDQLQQFYGEVLYRIRAEAWLE